MKALVLYLILGKEKIQGYDKFLLTFFSKVTWSQVFSLSKRDCKSPSVCRCVHLLNASAYGKNFVGGAEHNLPEWNLLVTDAQDDSFVTSSFLRHAVIANLPLSVGVCICWMHRPEWNLLVTDAQDDSFVTSSFLRHAVRARAFKIVQIFSVDRDEHF